MFSSVKTRTLGKLFLKLETRGKDGSGKRLSLILFSYLLPGVLLPFFLFGRNADPTGYDFAFLTFLFFSLLIAFSIISEFDNILISRSEAEIFSSLPLDDELIVKSKMYVLIRYIFITSLPLLLPASVFFYFIIRSVPRALLYFVSGEMMFIFLVFILMLLYGIAVNIFKSSRLSTFTTVFQVLMIFLLILTYQFASFSFTGKQSFSPNTIAGLFNADELRNYLPSGWFGFIPARHKFVPDMNFIVKMLLPFLITLFSYYSLRTYLMERYPAIREKYLLSRIIYPDKNNDKSARTGFITVFFRRVYLANYSESSSYNLMKSLYRRDKSVRLSILPMIVIPAALGIFAFITNQLSSPFSNDYFSTKPVFHVSILISVLVILNMGILGTRVTNFSGVSWIYDAYPISSKRRFINGIRKFFVVNMIYPVCTMLFILFLFKMSFWFALLHTLFIFGCVNLYNTCFHLVKKDLPFTKDNTILNSVQRLTSIFFPFAWGVIFVFLQVYVYRSMLLAVISVISILTVNYWTNYFGFHRTK